MEVIVSLVHNNRILRQTIVRVRPDIATDKVREEAHKIVRRAFDDIRGNIDHSTYDARTEVME